MNVNAQEELTVRLNNIKVYKNTKLNTFKITRNDSIFYDNLKLVELVEHSLQVLNKNNELFYLNDELIKVTYPKEVTRRYCGTVDSFSTKIIEKKNYYLIEKTTDPINSRKRTTKEIIDKIPKDNIKDIYFSTKSKSIRYDENVWRPETLIIETYDNKIGIRINNVTEFYDDIEILNPYQIKVKKNNLWGYNIWNSKNIKIKYKKINKFVYCLASFELENGEKGFVDTYGNEYFK